MPQINKSVNFKTLSELLKYIDKVIGQKGLVRYNMSGAFDTTNKQENYRLDWVVEEE